MALDENKVMKGILLVALAVLIFALSDVVTKRLTMLYAVPLVVAGRYLVTLLLLFLTLYPAQRSALWKTRRTGLVLLRGATLAAASLTMGLALRVMPVGETVAIIYLSPFAVMALSVPVLGEKVPLAGWIGAAIGFAGVLLILRPGTGLDPVGVAFALINAACATAYLLLTRVLARTESTSSMMFHTAWVGVVVFAVMVVVSGPGPIPGLTDTALIILLGVLATLGHFLFTTAYRFAPASLLAPVNYLHLVWAAVLGWLVFRHAPDAISLLGMALVVLAGAGVALRAHLAGRAALIRKGDEYAET